MTKDALRAFVTAEVDHRIAALEECLAMLESQIAALEERSRSRTFGQLKIAEALPLASFSPEGGEDLLRCMAGGTILRIGSTDERGIEGGGLLIHYVPLGETQAQRAVFAFNELGLWVEWTGPAPMREISQ
jgi:uncharacterized small protein (DUF1192 family)